MSAERIQGWLQVGGLLGVVASLIFVGMQMEQTQETADPSDSQARVSTRISVLTAPLASETLLRALTKDATGQLMTLTPEEELAASYFLWAQLAYFESEHYDYRRGHRSDEHWATVVENLQALFESELNRMIWRDSARTFQPSFREDVDRIVSP